MKRFLDLIVAFKEYVALSVFIALSLTFIAITRTAEVEPLRAFTTAVVGGIQSLYSWIPNPFTVARENHDLRERAIQLASEVGRLRRANAENLELRKMLGIAPRKEWQLRPAEVVGKTTSFQRNMLTIDVGEADGAKVGMAVVTDAGLVGRIYATSNGFSLVQMLFNTDFRAAARDGRSRVEGIVAWDGGPTLVMRNVPKALDVQIGDLVVTSEYSSYFSAEIPIGTIIRMEPEPNSLFRKITVDPAVSLYKVEHAYVIMKDATRERERLALEAKPSQAAKPIPDVKKPQPPPHK